MATFLLQNFHLNMLGNDQATIQMKRISTNDAKIALARPGIIQGVKKDIIGLIVRELDLGLPNNYLEDIVLQAGDKAIVADIKGINLTALPLSAFEQEQKITVSWTILAIHK